MEKEDARYELEAAKLHIEKLENEIEKLQDHLKKSNNESMERRLEIKKLEAEIAETDDLKKRLYATEQVMDSLNIPFKASDSDLSGLKVENGEVTGDFEWEAPKPSAELPKAGGGADSALTLEKISTMKPEEINKSWDQILELDRAGALS